MEEIALFHNIVSDPRIHRIERKLDYLIRAVLKLTGEEIMGRQEMDAAVTRMTAAIEKETSATAGVRTLLETVVAEMRANANDPGAINALADKLEGDAQKNADAVVANTDTGGGSGGGTGGTGGTGDNTSGGGQTGGDPGSGGGTPTPAGGVGGANPA